LKTIAQMQSNIAKLAWRLQYSFPPVDAHADDITNMDFFRFFSLNTNSNISQWQPKFQDAVDVILENMLQHVAKFS
jgi:hypothetical protein